MNKENAETWIKFYDRIRLFQRADELSIKVGLILVPILFGAIGISILIFMPDPINYWFAFSTFGVGLILLLFIISYSIKSRKRPPHVLIGNLLKITRISGSIGEKNCYLRIKVSEAFELSQNGKGETLKQFEKSEIERLFVLKHFRSEAELQLVRGEVIFLCVPNGLIVGFYYDGKLSEHLY